MSKVSFGADPELLLTKQSKPYSAIGVIQGGPDNRIKVKGHSFFYDNVLAECAIKPGKSKKEVINNFRECLQIYADMVKPFKLTPQASINFPESQLRHPDARKAGCAPDNCAYAMKQMEPPKEAMENGNLRSCGGHIHLGSNLLVSDGPEPILAIYALDLFVGISSLFLDRDPTAARRRALYGAAGRFRTKDYGIEYRSLSNFWLESPKMTELIYDLCIFSHDFVEQKKMWNYWEFSEEILYSTTDLSKAWTCKGYNVDQLRNGINISDKKMIVSHFDLAKNVMPKGLQADLQKMIDRPESNFYQNWDL